VRLATFLVSDEASPGSAACQRTGVVDGDELVDLTDAVIGLPGDMAVLLGLGDQAWERASAASSTSARRWGLAEVQLLAPVTLPPKILAIGLNYRAHVQEMGRALPAHQYWFNKQRTSVTGPSSHIVVPPVSDQVDYEGELGVVIRRRAKSVRASDWLDVVAGFTVVNDVSVRDWQAHSPTFTMGKSFDTHCPIGPWIVTPDEVGDVRALHLRTWVNDELRQETSTGDMVFGPDEMIEYLTTVFPLEPGDILSTGTPSGVGAGFVPPRWLKAGDVVRIEIDNVGVLENRVIAEPPPSPPRPLGG
jgi:2-keto-4-pentenoate hydratase/2-oxohepta-3-ene-1,7-dioic acid hydratase in catechol pathway